MTAIELKVDELRARLMRVFFLRRFLDLMTFWLFVFGAIVLLLRFLGLWTDQALFLNLVLLPLAVSAWRTAQKEPPQVANLRAWLDETHGCGGLLMADAERSLGSWQLTTVRLPRIAWPRRDAALRLAAAGLFLILAALLPYHWISPPLSGGLDLADEVADLKEKIEVLKETKIIDQAEQDRLEQTLERLHDEAEGDDPGKSWEALDHLNQSLSRRAENVLAEMDRLAEEQGLLSQMLETLDANRKARDPAELKAAMSELAQLSSRMAAENEALAQTLQSLDMGALEGMDGALSLNELAKSLNLSQEDLKKIAARLERARLVKLSEEGNLRKKGQDQGELLAFLEAEGKKGQIKALIACLAPGRGGISKGGAGAELTWTNPSNREGIGFEAKILNHSEFNDWEQSYQTGLSASAPKTGEASAANHGALTGSKSGAGSAFTHRLLPRHRKAVKRFFEKAKNE